MIKRQYTSLVEIQLKAFSAVGLLGPRQIGKTTLAHNIAETWSSVYLDLENYQDLAKLDDPIPYFEHHANQLIILDEIQRKPDIFMILRSVIDKRRCEGHKYGQFLILGSASLALLRQSSESLAGRISYQEMGSFTVIEVTPTASNFYQLWLRGGFPESFLSPSEDASMQWRQAFIKTYLERDIPQFGPRIPSELLRRLWIMLAHCQGTTLNAPNLAANLSISGQTVSRYVDLLADLFLVRRLNPWYENVNKRLVRSPKVYVRDSGILHALLNISTLDNLLSHPILAQSFEGFVIDNLLGFLPQSAQAYFYRTARGAEIDLVIKYPDSRILAIEIKKSSAPKISRGFYEGCKDIQPTHRYVVYDGEETFSLGDGTIAINLRNLMEQHLTF